MNYFRGSGSCGIKTAPNYKKVSNNLEKAILNQNVILNKNLNNAVPVAGKV
jgi:hypothetical protein